MKNPYEITAKEIEQITNSLYNNKITISWHGKKIKVYSALSFNDYNSLIKSILDLCTLESKDVIPEVVPFVFRSEVVSFYSNVELPSDVESRFFILFQSDLYKTISANINPDQLKSIVEILKAYTNINVG